MAFFTQINQNRADSDYASDFPVLVACQKTNKICCSVSSFFLPRVSTPTNSCWIVIV